MVVDSAFSGALEGDQGPDSGLSIEEATSIVVDCQMSPQSFHDVSGPCPGEGRATL